MRLDFRVDFGYQYLYSRRHYHPVYLWDGELVCTGGTVLETFRLDYPFTWFGQGQCAIETKLDAPEWTLKTKRGVAGIRFVVEVDEGAVFRICTLSGTFSFTVQEILRDGRIEFPVGPKYLGCHAIVTRTGYYWFRPAAGAGQQILEADALAASVPVRDWSRMRVGWIEPQGELSFEMDVPESKCEFAGQIMHFVCMAAPGYTPGAEKPGHGYIHLQLFCDGGMVAENTRFYRMHDGYMQMLEDLWLRFQVSPGRHTFVLRNCDDRLSFLVNRIVLLNEEHFHGELSLPRWALAGEKQFGRIFACREENITVNYDGGSCSLSLVPGWNEFEFTLPAGALNSEVTASCGTSGTVEAVYELNDEVPEVMVGFDMTTVPHDHSGTMDWLLDYTARTKLGNIVVFRSFLYKPEGRGHMPVDDVLLEKWGRFCREHHIYVEAATDFDSGALVRGAGDMLHSVGMHEWPGAVYAFDPKEEWQSEDMKSAMENCIRRLRTEVDRARKAAPRAAFGDASGGHRYCYMAGADFIRSETMVPHTQHLCSQARPAAEVFKDGEWGVHIAIQHMYQPYFETHIGQYFISLLQPWMMGANMIYEEDCLFNLFKEERQAWDDLLCKGKRDMTRDFYRFAKTHPRSGKPVRKIAFVEGRYAAPFNGFICDCEQDPDYSIWGLFGNKAPEWGHRQPEKCRQVLDVLMPGASTHPLRQDFAKRRFFFSGTPYGDFDEVPAEAAAEYLGRYSLLLHLGWNTMIAEDLDKLQKFVSGGGTLLIGLAQFSTHVRREFLRDMEDLALWNNGDLSEFCGVKVKGCGVEFCGKWNCAGRESYPAPETSGIPSKSPEEDGKCCLAELEFCGAEPFIWDAATGNPLVVRYNYGKGTVYLLTAYAYFGHEALRDVATALTAKLAGENRPECYVLDKSGEVFWNMWDGDGELKRLMLLNTDWTVAGNRKCVTVVTPFMEFETDVIEREVKMLTILPDMVIEQSPELFIKSVKAGRLEVHGSVDGELILRRAGGGNIRRKVFFKDTTVQFIDLD